MGLDADRRLRLADHGRASAGYAIRFVRGKRAPVLQFLIIGTVILHCYGLAVSEFWYRVIVIGMGVSSIVLMAIFPFYQ
jgi:hypothetical protein